MVSPFLSWLQDLYEFFHLWCLTLSFGKTGTSSVVSPAVQERDGINFGAVFGAFLDSWSLTALGLILTELKTSVIV